jgi:hypothetical protein
VPKVTAKSWAAIKTDYACGLDDVTLQVLADKHGVSMSAITHRAAREKWAQARADYRHTTSVKTQERAATLESEARSRFVNLGKLMQARGAARISKLDPETLEPEEARKLLKDGVDVEAKGLGIADGSGVGVNLNLTPEDIERMSDDELDALYTKLATAFRR